MIATFYYYLIDVSINKKCYVLYSALWKTHLRATEHHLPFGITQCYLPLNAGEHAHFKPSQTD